MTRNDPSPEALLARWREKRDPDALAALFDAASPGLFRLALTLEPDAAAAEDALQETFLLAVQGAERWDRDRPVIPWLAGVLRHKVQEGRRARRRRPSPERLPEKQAPEDPSALAGSEEERRRLHAAMEALPEPYREAALLRWRHGLEPAEIAALKRVPPGTVWSWLHRAVERLRSGSAALTGLLVGIRSPRGLVRVREAVLGDAARVAAGTALATTAAAGGLLVTAKSAALAAALVLMAAGGWWAWSDTPPSGIPAGVGTEAPSTVAGAGREDPSRAAAAGTPAEAAPASPSPLPPPVDLDACDRDRDLFGVVEDPDGRPVAGALLEAIRPTVQPVLMASTEERNHPVAGGSRRTAADGSFRIALEVGDQVDLRVTAPGFAETVLADRPAGARLRVVLHPGTTLTLHLVDENGLPVDGASLRILRPRERSELLVDRTAATGPDGVLVFRDLTEGDVSLFVAHPRLGPWVDPSGLEIAGDAMEATVTLTTGRTLTGFVRERGTGTPVAGALVGFTPYMFRPTPVAADGSFSVPGWVDEAGITLETRAPGHAAAGAVPPAAGPVLVELVRGIRVTGRTVDGEGAPLGEVPVFPGRWGQGALTRSDVEGRFSIAVDAAESAVDLLFRSPRRAPATRTVAAGTADDVDLGDIPLLRGRLLEGRFVDAGDEPLALVEVTCAPAAGAGGGRFVHGPALLRRRTDDLGRFRFSDLAPGRYLVAALPRIGVPPSQAAVTVPAEGPVPELLLRAMAVRDLHVRVVDAVGRPVGDARAGLEALDGVTDLGSSTVPADGNGLCVFPAAPRIPLEVWVDDSVSPPRFASASAEVDVSADEVTVTVDAAAAVEGRVVDDEGRPVPGVAVEFRVEGDGDLSQATTADADGRFRLDTAMGTTGRVGLGTWIHPGGNGPPRPSPWRAEPVLATAPAGDVVLRARQPATHGSLRVLVTDLEGRPLEGYVVVLVPPPGRRGPLLTGADGRCSIEDLPAEELEVRVLPPPVTARRRGLPGLPEGQVLPPSRRVVPSGQEEVFTLREGAAVRGRVLRADGSPAAGARVTVGSKEGEVTAWAEARTGPDGRFTAWVPPGGRTVHIAADLTENGITESAFLRDDDIPAEGEIELRMKAAR